MKSLALILLIYVLLISFATIRVEGYNPSYEILAVQGFTPTIDGAINLHEWNDASSVTFNKTQVLVKQDGHNLYIGFNMSYAPSLTYDQVMIFLDLDNNGGLTPQPDDIGLVALVNGTLLEVNVTGGVWTPREVNGWSAEMQSNLSLWHVEFNITYSKIGVVAGVEKTIGAFFISTYVATTHYYWPPTIDYGDYGVPSDWGAICIHACTGHNPDYDVLAVYGTTPLINGLVNSQEWSDASLLSFSDAQVFVKQDGMNLYIAFNVSNQPLYGYDAVSVLFDVDHDENITLQLDDIGLSVFRNGTLMEANVTGKAWTIIPVSGWTAQVNSTSNMWQAEFNITYAKIEITAGVEKTVGVTFHCYRSLEDSSPDFTCWPLNSYSNATWNPSSWGDMTSSGYDWIPEFSSLALLPTLMVASLPVVFALKKEQYYAT